MTPVDERNRTRTGAPPGCASNRSFSFASTDGVHAGGRQVDHERVGRATAGRRRDAEIGLAHLDRADLQLAAAQVDAAGREHDAVGLDHARHRLVHARERDHVDAAREALEPELRVGLAALRVLARDRADDAADRDEVAVAERVEVGDLVGALRPRAPRAPRAADGRSRTGRASPSRAAAACACRTPRPRAPTRRSLVAALAVVGRPPPKSENCPAASALRSARIGADTLSWACSRPWRV